MVKKEKSKSYIGWIVFGIILFLIILTFVILLIVMPHYRCDNDCKWTFFGKYKKSEECDENCPTTKLGSGAEKVSNKYPNGNYLILINDNQNYVVLNPDAMMDQVKSDSLYRNLYTKEDNQFCFTTDYSFPVGTNQIVYQAVKNNNILKNNDTLNLASILTNCTVNHVIVPNGYYLVGYDQWYIKNQNRKPHTQLYNDDPLPCCPHEGKLTEGTGCDPNNVSDNYRAPVLTIGPTGSGGYDIKDHKHVCFFKLVKSVAKVSDRHNCVKDRYDNYYCVPAEDGVYDSRDDCLYNCSATTYSRYYQLSMGISS